MLCLAANALTLWEASKTTGFTHIDAAEHSHTHTLSPASPLVSGERWCVTVIALVSCCLIDTSGHSGDPCARQFASAAAAERMDLVCFRGKRSTVRVFVTCPALERVPITPGLFLHHFASVLSLNSTWSDPGCVFYPSCGDINLITRSHLGDSASFWRHYVRPNDFGWIIIFKGEDLVSVGFRFQ